MNIMDEGLQQTHKLSFNNREAIERSKECGCFCCLAKFGLKSIVKWIDKGIPYGSNQDGNTALCPFCKVDSVIGDASWTITDEFLKQMQNAWFGPPKLDTIFYVDRYHRLLTNKANATNAESLQAIEKALDQTWEKLMEYKVRW